LLETVFPFRPSIELILSDKEPDKADNLDDELLYQVDKVDTAPEVPLAKEDTA